MMRLLAAVTPCATGGKDTTRELRDHDPSGNHCPHGRMEIENVSLHHIATVISPLPIHRLTDGDPLDSIPE